MNLKKVHALWRKIIKLEKSQEFKIVHEFEKIHKLEKKSLPILQNYELIRKGKRKTEKIIDKPKNIRRNRGCVLATGNEVTGAWSAK